MSDLHAHIFRMSTLVCEVCGIHETEVHAKTPAYEIAERQFRERVEDLQKKVQEAERRKISEARDEALEEAAKIASTANSHIAEKIRALKSTVKP